MKTSLRNKFLLKNCCVSITDGDHLPPPKASTGVPFITISNIINNQISFADTMYVDRDYYEKLDASRKAMHGDILYSVVGSFGIPVYIDKDDEFVFQRHIAILRPDSSIVDNRYLYYTLLNPGFYKIANRIAIGCAQRTVTLDLLRNIEIVIPEVSEQEQIARVISNIDRKISLNDAINSELESAARTLYDYWFTQFDFPDANGKPYKSSGGAMVWSEELKREIPQGWEMAHLSNELTFKRGVEPGSDSYSDEFSDTHTVPFIRVRDLGDKSTVYIQPEIANGCLCEPNDVLVAFDGSVGKMSIGMHGCCSSGIRNIKPRNDKFSQAFIYLYFSSQEAQGTIAKYAVGSNILHAASCIEHFLFAYEEKTVNEFIHRIEPMYRQMVANLQQNEELTELRDFLLPLLMNGQVRVANGRSVG